MLKRIISLSLCAALIVTMLPLQTIALDAEADLAEAVLDVEISAAELEPADDKSEPTENADDSSELETEAEEEIEPVVEGTEPMEEVTESIGEEPEPEVEKTTAPSEEPEPVEELEQIQQEPMLADAVSGSCGENATWIFDDRTGTLTISGTGAMTDYASFTDLPFEPYRSQIRAVIIENGITTIGDKMFSGCNNLSSITIPSSVVSIGASAFSGSSGLVSIELPVGMKTLKTLAFDSCISLRSVVLPDGLETIGVHAFRNCGMLEAITIPGTVRHIEEKTFEDCANLVTVTLEEGVTSIGERAFYYCYGLTSITLPSTIQDIAAHAFSFCSGLQSIVIPSGVTSINQGTFGGCSSLHTIEFPQTLLTIGEGAFVDCCGLTEIDISDSVTAVGARAFMGCGGLERITIPGGVSSIDNETFLYCDSLNEIVFEGNAPAFAEEAFLYLNTMVRYPADNATWTADVMQDYGGNILWIVEGQPTSGACGENLTWTLDMNSFAIVISGSGAMYDYSAEVPAPWNLYASNVFQIAVESGVTSIGKYAFAGMPMVDYVELPDTLTSIGEGAFSDCPYLKSVVIPAGVTEIAGNVFGGSSAVTNVTFLGDVPQLEDGLFDGKTVTVKYPYDNTTWTEEEKGKFAGTITWYLCDSQGVAIQGTCGTSAEWFFDLSSGTLTISGSGAMKDLTGRRERPAWNAWTEYIETVVIETGITHIGTKSFTSVTNLKSVTIPDTVQTIGTSAFSYCENLTDLVIPNSVTSISSSAFHGCINLELTIPASVSSIGLGAVQKVLNLVVDGDNANYVSYRGLLLNKDKTILYSYSSQDMYPSIPDTVTVIGEAAYAEHPNIYEISIPQSVETIEANAFAACEALETVIFEDAPSVVSGYAFGGCYNLTVITFKGNPLKTVAEDAFYDVNATAYYPGGNPNWTETVMQDYGGTLTWTASDTLFGGTCGNDLVWVYDTDYGILTISGTGTMMDYSADAPAPWSEYADDIMEIVVEPGVTSIGSHAFTGITNMYSLTVPETLTGIGEGAFSDCVFNGSQVKITIPAAVNEIGKDAFSDCTGLTAIEFQGDLPALAQTLFSEDMTLIAYYPADNATWTESARNHYGGSVSWYGCDENGNAVGACGDALTWTYAATSRRLTISGTGAMTDYSPENPAPWSGLASELRYLTIESGVTTIGSYAFAGLGELGYSGKGSSTTAVTFPASLTKVGEKAFYNCLKLGKLIFLGDLPVLADTIFSEDMLVYAYYPYGNITWTEDARKDYGCPVSWYPSDEYGTPLGGNCGEMAEWSFEPVSATLTISGSGEMNDISLRGGTVPWSAWKSSIEKIVIGTGITRIGSRTFSGTGNLKNVEISDTVETVGSSAFYNCAALTELKLPDSVAILEDYAFEGCTNLALTLGANISDVGFRSIRNIKSIAVDEENANFAAESGLLLSNDRTVLICCAAAQASYVIPDTVTTIGEYAFCDHDTLTEVVIPEGVKTIGQYAFSGCLSLQTVDLPDSLVTLGMDAFRYTGLTEIAVPEGTETLDTGVFGDNEQLERVVFAGKVVQIDNDQFYGCSNLQSIRFKADAPENFSENVFYGVTATAYYPEGNTTWTEAVKQNYGGTITWEVWQSPTSGICGDNLSWVYNANSNALVISGTGEMTDYTASNPAPWNDWADSICYLELESGITSIGNYAFADMKEMEIQESLPDTLTKIGAYAFSACGEYFTSVILPAGVTQIGKNAFAGNVNLTKVTFQGDMPVLADPLFSENMTLVAMYPNSNTSWTESALKNYGGNVSWYSTTEDGSLVGSCGNDLTWTVKNSVLTISGTGDMADYSPENPAPWRALAEEIRTLTIESGVTSIGSYAFADMYRLGFLSTYKTAPSIPANITSIGENAFSGCTSLIRLNFLGDLPVMDAIIFSGDMTIELYYPDGNATWTEEARKDYGGNAKWYRFDENGIDLEGSSSETADWQFDPASGTLTLTGSGEVYSIGGRTSYGPWNEWTDKIVKVVIESGITRIGDSAFLGLPALMEVSMPDTLEEIGYGAFQDCANLVTAQIPAAVTGIEHYAFDGCSSLELTIPAGVSSIGNCAVRNVKTLSVDAENETYASEGDMLLNKAKTTLISYAVSKMTYVIPETVTTIGEAAFQGCPNLTEITIPDTVQIIEAYAFAECADLTTVALPQSLTILNHRVFGFTGLTEITIPDSVEEIDIRAFEGCGKLEKVVFAGEPRVHTIDYCAFDGCTSLKTIELPDSVTTLGEYAFEGTGLTKIRIPDSMKVIGGGAFMYCSDLENVAIEGKLETLGWEVFNYSSNLKSIRFMGDAPENIDDYAFDGVYYSTAVYYPGENVSWTEDKLQNYGGSFDWSPWETSTRGSCGEGLTWQYDEWNGILTISGTGAMADYTDGYVENPNYAPWSNLSIKSIVLEEGITHIGSYAFVDTGLTWISLPEGIVSIGECALPRQLTSLDIPASLTSVYFENLYYLERFNVADGNTAYTDVDGVLFSADMTRLIRMPECWVTDWDEKSFVEYTVPATVVELCDKALYGCDFLKTVILPDNLEIIGDQAISCLGTGTVYGPETIILPKNVTSIGTDALESAKLVVFTGDAPAMADDVFSSCAKTAYYPAGNITWAEDKLLDYGGDLTWIPYETDIPTSGTLSDTIGWSFDEATATLTVSGTGVMSGYHYAYLNSDFITPWLHLTDRIEHVVIEEGITEIGNGIFKNHYCLQTVTLPESLRIICDSAFYNNPALREVTLKEGLITIEYGAFSGCSALESIRIPDTVTSIAAYAFFNCTNLTTVELPEGIERLEDCTFAGCTSLEEIHIPATVISIDSCVFEGCTDLKQVEFTGDVPFMVYSAFNGVTAEASYPADNATWTEDVLLNYGGSITWLPVMKVENRVALNSEELKDHTSVWIDGKEYIVNTVNGIAYVDLRDSNAKTMVVYTYGESNGKPYPTGMKVWTLSNTDGFYTATRVEELDDMMTYAGCSIRIKGDQGIRMITSIDQTDKDALTAAGLAGYTLEEYGTAIAWASQIGTAKPLTLGKSYVSSNYAYKKGVADPIFHNDDNVMQYTNVLVGFTLDQCKDDIAMRPYMILKDTEGNEITLYGGIVERSIGYIAQQNQDTYAEGTEEYAYIMNIINHVFGGA